MDYVENNQKINFNEIEKKIRYHFNNQDLLEQAFTRSSYALEKFTTDNEVLEFIGDSIVGNIVVKRLISHYSIKTKPIPIEMKKLYSIKTNFSCELDEAELSELKISLVQRSSLSAATERLGLEKYLLMGKSDVLGNVQNQASVKEDLFEAIIGATAIDCNWDMNILERVVSEMLDIENILENGTADEEDYEKSLKEWFDDNEETANYASVPCICENLTYGFSINLGFNMLNYEAYGYGSTEKGAKRMAAKRAMNIVKKTVDRKTTIISAVGSPDLDRAINQLQELYQKNIIPEPKYTFSEQGNSNSGNPQWTCECAIDGLVENSGGYTCASKNEAKKHIAFEALNYLIGRDLNSLFTKHGKEISKNKN